MCGLVGGKDRDRIQENLGSAAVIRATYSQQLTDILTQKPQTVFNEDAGM